MDCDDRTSPFQLTRAAAPVLYREGLLMHRLNKTPWERTRISVDFNNELADAEAIDSFTVTCLDMADDTDTLAAIVHASAQVADYPAEVFLLVKGGALGEKHKVTVQVTTSFSNVFEEEVMVVLEQSECGSFTKQPNDVFSFLVDFANDFEPSVLERVLSVEIAATDRDTGAVAAVISGSVIDGTTVVVGVTGGLDGHEYDISLQVIGDFYTWTPAQQVEQIIVMKVRET